MIWCVIHASLGLAKALGRAKLALYQMPVLKKMTLAAERGVLPSQGYPFGCSPPAMLLMSLLRTTTANTTTSAFPGSINHRFDPVSALRCRKFSMRLLETLR